MTKYHKCTNCGNTEKGYQLSQCKDCGKIFCVKVSAWGLGSASGCGRDRCPGCGGKVSNSRAVGTIGS